MNKILRLVQIGGLGLVLLGGMVFLGCASRQHMSPDYGNSAEAVLEAERVYPSSSNHQPDGLDSEEAAIVHDSYRRSISHKDSSASGQNASKVLLIEDDKKK